MHFILVALVSFTTCALASPAPNNWDQSPSCGTKGYDQGTIAYSYKEGSKVATFEGCGSRCAAQSKCKSFAFGNGACLLYKVTVASNVAQDSSSPYTFYDSGCTPDTTPPASLKSSKPSIKPTKPPSTKSSRPSSKPSSLSRGSGGPAPQGKCGVAGYDKGKPEAYHYSQKTKYSTLAGCAALCQAEGCTSFAVGSGGCFLYSSTVAQNVDPDSGSPYRFYDAGCTSATLGPTSPRAFSTPNVSKTASRARSSKASEFSLSSSSRTRRSNSFQVTSTVSPTATPVSSTLSSSSSIQPSASASTCWTALGSGIPSPSPNNLIQNNLQNGFWDQWSIEPFGNANVTNDCPGYNGQPSGKFTVRPSTGGELSSGAALSYTGYTYEPGIHYKVSLRVNFDAPSQCLLTFNSYIGSYIAIDQASSVSGDVVPINTWTVLSGSFVAKTVVEETNLGFILSCDGLDTVTLRITDFVFSKVSAVTYSTGMPPTGPELIANSEFSDGVTGYSIVVSPNITYSGSATEGTSGSPGLVVNFPAEADPAGLTFQELSIQQTINVVKDAVYEASFDFSQTTTPPEVACTLAMGPISGNYALNIYGTMVDFLPVGPFQHLSAIFASPVDGTSFRISITCIRDVLPAQTFYFDNVSVRQIS